MTEPSSPQVDAPVEPRTASPTSSAPAPWWVKASWAAPLLSFIGNISTKSAVDRLVEAGGPVAMVGHAFGLVWGALFLSGAGFGLISLVAAIRHKRLAWALQGLAGMGVVALFVLAAVVGLMAMRARGG